MDQKTIQAISKQIYDRFPEVKGKKPKVRFQKSSGSRSIARHSTYLLTYNSNAKTATNKSLPYSVRVVANEEGKILKITMSH
jgi:hypothetical protein